MAEPQRREDLQSEEIVGPGSAAPVAPLALTGASRLRTLDASAPARVSVGDRLVLRLALLNSLFALALVAARLAYHGHVHPVVYVAVGVVLVVYAAGAAQATRMAWWPGAGMELEDAWQQGLARLDRLAARCPKVAMAGTVTGFLIAFGGSTEDVAQRIRGASTGLAATLIGIVAMLLLELQHDWLAARHETH